MFLRAPMPVLLSKPSYVVRVTAELLSVNFSTRLSSNWFQFI